jgi:hypothetical protein
LARDGWGEGLDRTDDDNRLPPYWQRTLLPTPPADFEITRDPDGHHHLPRHGAYASIGFEDLWAIAPWLKEEIGGRLEGGVGYLRASQGSEV